MMKRLLLVLALLSLPCFASITVVQGAATASAPSKAFTTNNTAPNLIIACAINATSGGTNSFSDTNLNSYRDPATGTVGPVAQVPYSASANSISCAYAENIAAGANTVSYTCSAGCGGFTVTNIVEISGLPTSSSLDQFVSNPNATAGSGTDNETSTAKTTTVNGELIFGYSADNIGPDTAGTGFTFTPNNIGSSETQVQGTAGSIAATVTSGHNGDLYAALMITFKPAGATGGSSIVGKTTVVGGTVIH